MQCLLFPQQSSRWPGGRQETGGIYQLLSCFKVCNDNFSLKEQVSRKQFKEKYKKRRKSQPVAYEGRTYDDYLKFKDNNPNVPTTQMDTVMNSLSGPYIQTFLFENTSFMIGFLHNEKTSQSMSDTLDNLQDNILTDE